jgi:ATP:ADP antiporter, AAA family
MLKRIATALWGNFENKQELKKFLFLAAIFGLIIGVYWTLRPVKDSAFGSVVGGNYLPWAKILSTFVTFIIVLLYAKLVDMFPRHKVFYGIVSLYAILAGVFAWFFMDPVVGFANEIASPDRLIGWAFYVWVESFGSLIVALFWAITTDITAPESAKRGFPIIAMFGQFGNICGPLFLNTGFLGLAHSGPIVAACAVLMALIVVLFYGFVNSISEREMRGYHQGEATPDAEPGFFEGLKLLLTHRYLLGLFFIVSVYELVITILDNHFKQAVFLQFPTEALRSAYLSSYAVWVGIVATICIVLGINNITRILGVGVSLTLTPILVGCAVLWIKFNPFSVASACWIMICSKAVNYALNGPSLKLLYIPTSKDTKYKAQSWIEMFGSRASKGAASAVNVFRPTFLANYGPIDGLVVFLTFTSITSFGLIGVWLMVALFAAKTYNKAIKENKIVC